LAASDSQGSDHEALRDAVLLKEAVREAGGLALSMFGTDVRNWIKGASSPVSDADIAANDLLERRLRSATPDYGWLSEESVDDPARLEKRRVWIVDNIDGTRSYLAGRSDWCVSVALVENAAPILAAVFAPVTDEFFFAGSGQGTLLNDAPVRASSGTALDFSRVAGPKPLVERLAPSKKTALHPNRLARASPVPGGARCTRCRLCRWAKPRLGSCRGSFDRPGSEW